MLLFALLSLLLVGWGLQWFENAFSEKQVATDTFSYLEAASLLFAEGKAHPTRTFGSAIVLGLPYLFSSSVELKSIMIFNYGLNLILWLATTILLFRTISLFASTKLASLASALYILCFGAMSHVGLILTEPISTFLLTLCGFLAFRFLKDKQVKDLGYICGILLVSVLIRPGMLYWALLITLITCAWAYRSGAITFRWLRPIIFGLGCILLQSVSVHKEYGNFTVSYIDKVTWYNYLGAQVEADLTERDYWEVKAEHQLTLSQNSWPENSILCKEHLVHQVKNSPLIVLQHFVKNIGWNAIGKNYGISAAQNFSGSSIHKPLQLVLSYTAMAQNLLFVLGSIILGIVLLVRREWNVATVIVVGSIAYIIFTSGISFNQGDRFNVVFYPLTLMLLSYSFAKTRFAQQLG